MKSDGRVLIADDQPDVLEALRLLLRAKGLRSNPHLRRPGFWRRSKRAISMWS